MIKILPSNSLFNQAWIDHQNPARIGRRRPLHSAQQPRSRAFALPFAAQWPDTFTWEYLVNVPGEARVKITKLKPLGEPSEPIAAVVARIKAAPRTLPRIVFLTPKSIFQQWNQTVQNLI
jgi:hypothetical protein